MTLVWSTATDPAEVHALIELSDRAAARRSGGIPPNRRPASTAALVEAGVVQLGRLDGCAVVTVTVSPTPSFAVDGPVGALLPAALRPWYMQRLAVDPASAGALVGFHAVRHALATARAGGADALRAEAHPGIADVLGMLEAVGFCRVADDPAAPELRTYLQCGLEG